MWEDRGGSPADSAAAAARATTRRSPSVHGPSKCTRRSSRPGSSLSRGLLSGLLLWEDTSDVVGSGRGDTALRGAFGYAKTGRGRRGFAAQPLFPQPLLPTSPLHSHANRRVHLDKRRRSKSKLGACDADLQKLQAVKARRRLRSARRPRSARAAGERPHLRHGELHIGACRVEEQARASRPAPQRAGQAAPAGPLGSSPGRASRRRGRGQATGEAGTGGFR